MNLVLVERLGDLFDVVVINGICWSRQVSLGDLETVIDAPRGQEQIALLTLRPKTMTLCVPSSRKASTMVLPTLPVPPTTATATMMDEIFFEGL